MTLSLTSPAFAPNGDIPEEYTCDGKDLAPPLEWSGAPAGTRSFAIIVDDPDAPDPQAPKTIWVHWVLYDIPASWTLPWAIWAARRGRRSSGPWKGTFGRSRAGWDLPAREVVAVHPMLEFAGVHARLGRTLLAQTSEFAGRVGCWLQLVKLLVAKVFFLAGDVDFRYPRTTLG
jgi:hypothetical protein